MTARRTTPTRVRPRPARPEASFLENYLDPIDRLVETIYSVLIILSFTLAYRFFRLDPGEVASPEYVNDLLWAVLGATFAWGLIDGIVYLLAVVFERGERHRLLWYIQAAQNEEEALEAIADELDYFLEPISGEEQRQMLFADILEHLQDNEPRRIGIKREDLAGAAACILVAFLAVLPAMVPILLLPDNYALAIRLSNLVSFGVLFYSGFQWGRYTRTNPWKLGLVVMSTGVILVVIAIFLGT